MIRSRPVAPRLPAASRPRRGERGASLLLAFMVLLVLLVVLAEVLFKSQIETSHTMAFVDGTRFRLVADAAIRDAEATLMMDIDRDEGLGSGLGGSEDEEGEDGEDPFGAGGGDEGGAADGGDVTATTDSKLDEWMHSESLIPVVGGGYTVLVEVVDEDRKINLLGLWAEDEEERDRHREVVERLIDKAFEGTTNDLGVIDAGSFIDRLEDWVKGNRSNSSNAAIPAPKLKPSLAEQEAEDDPTADQSFFDEEHHFPLTLNELSMLEGVDPVHLWGFVEDDRYYPGLMDLVTIWSHLELLPEPEEEDEFADSPFGSLGDADNAEEEAEEEEELIADPTPDGLVNLNTAPLVVLRALAGDDIPTSYLEKIAEFRRKIDELEEEQAGGASLLGGFGDAGFDSGEEGEDGESEDDGEKDVTDYVFEDPANLWDMIEDEFDVVPAFDSDIQDDFTRLFTTRSQTFTIKVLVFDEVTGRRQSFRKVVWRMQTPEGPRMVPLRPMEPYWDPRRLRDFEIEFDDLRELRDQQLRDLQYEP